MFKDNRFYTEMSAEPLGQTQIGTPYSIKNTKFKRLNNLNNIPNFKSMINKKIYYETKRILSNLDLPIQILSHIIYNTTRFYNKLPKGTKYHSIELLVSVATYITCLQEFYFINIKELYNTTQYNNTHNFGKCLKMIYRLFPNLYKKFLSKEFRIKTILNQLMGLKIYFRFPHSFFFIASQILETHYELLKNTKINVITAKIFRLTKNILGNKMNKFKDIKICRYLGVQSSVCSNIKI